ncbi:MAG: pyridoxal phosphate-dependent aminotransferase [Acidobacteriota bacterium]
MAASSHPVDAIELGGIVTVRDRLIEQQARGKKVYRLESGDPSFAVAPHITDALSQALRDGHTHYTAGAGIKPLREALYRKLCDVNHLPLDSFNDVLVTNGAMNALYVAFGALCDPGDEIIMPDPTWTETADNVSLAGGVAVRAPLPAPSYHYTADVIAPLITKRTRAIVINSPHNPTGMVSTPADIEGIVRLAERHGVWVLSDEAYEHVLFDGRTHVSAGALGYPKVISIYSFSKSYAMSGLRVGYVAVHDPLLLERLAKLLRCTINGVNSATQVAAVSAITGPQDVTLQMAAEYQHRRDALWEGLKNAKAIHPVKPEGAFYMWARIDEKWEGFEGKRGGWAMTNYLIDKAGVGSAPGEVFGPSGAGHIRFAFSCSTDQVVAAAKILGELLN